MDSENASQDYCRRVDELCSRLIELGMRADANRISHRLHNVSWTSSNELIHELYRELRKIGEGPSSQMLPADLKDELASCINVLAQADTLCWTPEVGPPRDR